jgi:signal transduction histidine kinase
MFNRLRNRFLLINMLLTTAVVMSAFAIIYLITYQGIMQTGWQKLDSLVERNLQATLTNSPANGMTTIDTSAQTIGDVYDRYIFLVIDDNGGIIEQHNNTTLTEADIPFDLTRFTGSEKSNGQLDFAGSTWLYRSEAFIYHQVVADDYNSGGIEPNGLEHSEYLVTFIDISSSVVTLQTLLLTFLVVALVLLVFIFLISLFFANRSIKPIQEAWQRQHQFIADASHELKTPLAIITSNYDVLADDPSQTIASQIQWLNNLKTGIDRMGQLANRLLQLEKAENESIEVVKTNIDIKKFVLNELEPYTSIAEARQISLSFDTANSEHLQAQTDPVIFGQVIETLLENAFKYTPDGGWVVVEFRLTQGKVCVSIKNSGAGIPEEDLPFIFNRFYRSDKARHSEANGFGLGLAIAQRLCDSIGAQISASSVPGESTSFSVLL